MKRDQNAGKEQAKHISMELTADAARVTNLVLDGSRLILTIEAELAGSQLRATDVPPAAKTPEPAKPHVEDKSETQFVFSNAVLERAEAAVSGEETTVDDFDGDVMQGTSGGSEAVRPIPELARPPSSPTTPPAASAAEPVADSQPDDGQVDEVFEPMPPLDQDRVMELPEAPPFEPVREATDTWDDADGPAPSLEPTRKTTRIVRADPRPEQAAPTTAPFEPGELEINETWVAKRDIMDEDVRTVGPVSRPTETMTASDINTLAGAAAVIAPETASPADEAPEAANADDVGDLPAAGEESSAIGGERHGEPQPSIAFFGVDEPETLDRAETPTEPEPRHEPAEEPPAPSAPEAEREKASSLDNNKAANAPLGGGMEAAHKHEAGGTTVLIRYTCPKCRTQGMQAVDKVGTVVNCSNCGKAMRLVMKK